MAEASGTVDPPVAPGCAAHLTRQAPPPSSTPAGVFGPYARKRVCPIHALTTRSCMHVRTCVHMCMYAGMHACLYVCMYVYTYVLFDPFKNCHNKKMCYELGHFGCRIRIPRPELCMFQLSEYLLPNIYTHTNKQTNKHTYIFACMHTCTHIHTYRLTDIQTYRGRQTELHA